MNGFGVNYFRLSHRVPEPAAMEPKAVAWLYALLTETPLMRTAHHRFVAGALAQTVDHGLALDVGTGPGYVAVEVARGQPGLRLVGLDLAAHMVARAQRYAAWTNMVQRLVAYSSVPALSLAFGSYRGYGGYYESLRAGYTLAEARDLLARSALPPGEVRLNSTWFVPILTIASRSST
jgi:SAM-dependent methyltransferase